jgi:predicted O-methyltransferase YrrM
MSKYLSKPAQLWVDVDAYLTDRLAQPDAVLDAVLAGAHAAGLPDISVSPTEGKLLQLLALAVQARKILEIGTLAGYSTICLARALPAGGKVITLEADAKCAEISRRNFAAAGLTNTIDLRLGKALDSLPRLASEKQGPFDLVFIDADKENNVEYFEWALKLSRTGSLIIVDNVVRDGAVLDAASRDSSVQGVRRFLDALAADNRVTATAIQTVGRKGHDGFSIAIVMPTK